MVLVFGQGPENEKDPLRQRQQGGAGYNTEDQYASNIVNGIEDDLQRAKDVQKNMLSTLPAKMMLR